VKTLKRIARFESTSCKTDYLRLVEAEISPKAIIRGHILTMFPFFYNETQLKGIEKKQMIEEY